MKGKTILIVGLGLFVILIVKDPNAAAGFAMGAWGLLDKLMSFFVTLAQH
jgi:hypothetical protein